MKQIGHMQLHFGETAGSGSNFEACLAAALKINGATGAALADWQSGICLGVAGVGPIYLHVAVDGAIELIRAKHRVLARLGVRDVVEEISITLGQQVHVLRPVSRTRSLFLYLELNKAQATLGLARCQLAEIADNLRI